MTDKIVYVHADHEAESVTIITPQDLDALLEADWAVKEQARRRVEGKMVDVYHLYKPSKERGLSVQRPRQEVAEHHQQHRGGSDARGLTVAPSNNSFLGTSDFNGLPGLKVANSMVIQHAFAMGTDAANRGEPIDNCPWPDGVGRTQWLKGYKAAAKGGASGDTSDAYTSGKLSAQGDADLEVHCPYPSGTAHYNEWLRGFRDAGGVVQ